MKENPPCQKTVAQSFKRSVLIFNKILNTDLNFNHPKKHNFYRLSQRHFAERKTRYRILYEKHLRRKLERKYCFHR